MQKIYAYVDETGTDARSQFFLVSVVIIEQERELIAARLEQIEKTSGKSRRKWMITRDEQKVVYMQQVLSFPLVKRRLLYAVYPGSKEYMTNTVLTTARAITVHAQANYTATVFIDGLAKSLIPQVGASLRRLHIRTQKVRGVRKEESDPLMRLADALCGFVRAALADKGQFGEMLRKAKQEDYIREL